MNARRWVPTFLLLFVLSQNVSLTAATGPLGTRDETDKKRPMNVEDVLAIKSVRDVSISADGRWVAYVVTARNFEENINDSDLWLVSAEGSEPVRLTYHKGEDRSPQWAPDGSWLAFLSKRGDKTQIYGIKPNGGEAWPVTEWKTSVNDFTISPDGNQVAFIAQAEKSQEQEMFEKERGRPIIWYEHYADQWHHLWVAALEERRAGQVAQSSPDNLHVTGMVWAPDSKQLALAARPSPTLRTSRQGAVYVVEAGAEEARQITDMPGGESPVAWSKENGLLVSGTGSIHWTFNREIWRVPLEGGEPISLTEALDEHAGFVAANANAVFVEVAHRTGRQIVRVPLQRGQPAGEPQFLADGNRFAYGFSSTTDGAKVAFLGESGDSPANVYFASTANFSPKQLTDLHQEVRQFELGAQSVVSWKSRAGGELIEGVMTLPVNYRKGTTVPLLLVIHGGPAGVSSDRFSASRGAYPIQVFAGKGYAVLQPNYRGSAGYGERFRSLNRGDISGRDWIDIDSGVDELIRQGIADPNRLGIMGWSFGGHHTYWGITQTDRYKAASAGAGANDLISMYSQTDIPDFYHTYLGPKPWEDFKLYEERSAYRNVAKVTTPLLIQVGEKDERVPAEQSIQFFEAVRAIGKAETQLIVYPDQPHGIRDPRLRRDLLIRNVEWFERWIPLEGTN